ncbi:hypothetical protein HZA85_01130 [Candidatus Uhrbacteria bacterium]|nr:hypothetical protein [Candidatus Uhrbacteria bacterium]
MSSASRFNTDFLVSLAAGIFIGGAFFDVLPEASKDLGIIQTILWMLAGYLVWWAIKRILPKFKQPALPFLTALALWFHSVLEGLVTGLSFSISQTFGSLIFVAMTLHILPEFFAAMALMKGAGSTTRHSLRISIVGFILLYASLGVTLWFLPNFHLILPVALAFSGGAFIFVGLASFWKRKSLLQLVFLCVSVGLMFFQNAVR